MQSRRESAPAVRQTRFRNVALRTGTRPCCSSMSAQRTARYSTTARNFKNNIGVIRAIVICLRHLIDIRLHRQRKEKERQQFQTSKFAAATKQNL